MGNLNTCKRGSKKMTTPVVVADRVEIDVEGGKPLPAVFFRNHQTKMGVIVLQEWWGMNQQIQDEAKEIAQDGNFTTIVPDLYRGKVTAEEDEANHLMSNLDWPGALVDIRACAKFLLSKGCTKVGVTGFCMGGALSMAAAGKVEEITASAPFYGICPDGLCDPSTIKIPLQCHFGKLDDKKGFTDPESQDVLEKKLKDGKVPHKIYKYDAGHAFTNKTGPNYKEDACRDSLRRMYEFFKKELA